MRRKESPDQVDVSIALCKKTLTWMLYIDTPLSSPPLVIDVIPVLETFSGIMYSPYEIMSSEEMDTALKKGTTTIKGMCDLLLAHLMDYQRSYIREKLSYNHVLLNCLDEFGGSSDFSLLITSSTNVLIQFPLLKKERLHCPDIEYLDDLLEDNPIMVCLNFGKETNNSSSSSSSIKAQIDAPTSLPCTKALSFPSFGADMQVSDYTSMAENIISMNLSQRRTFVLEMLRISASIEFDALDFSFVAFTVRLKSASMFSVCVVEVRLSHAFPDTLPLASIHDLSTNFSAPIESHIFSRISQSEPALIAQDFFKVVCKQIHDQAFT